MNNSKFLLFLLMSTLLFAQYENTDWEAEYKKLRESDYDASNLKRHGEFKEISPNIKKALIIMRPKIHEMATVYGVDPRAIVASIVTENSINIGIEDRLQDFLVESGAAKDGSFMGKSFSFGWGQLYMDAALEAEKIIAKKENREEYEYDVISKNLTIPEEAMKYAAALLRHHQDVYKNCGCEEKQKEFPYIDCSLMDISKKPEMLATIYNLGRSERFCKKTIQRMIDKGPGPKYNFFGMFTAMKLDEIEEIVGTIEEDEAFSFALSSDDNLKEILNSVGENKRFGQIQLADIPVPAPTPVPEKSNYEKFISFAGSLIGIEDEEVDEDPNKKLNELVRIKSGQNVLSADTPEFEALAFKSEVIGFRMPKSCIGKKDETSSMRTINLKPNLPIVSSSKIINCGIDQWVEITLSDGTSGWVKKEEILLNTKEVSKKNVKCSSLISAECKQEIKNSTGLELENSVEKGGLIYKIKSTKKGDYESPSCKSFRPRKEFLENHAQAVQIIEDCKNKIKGISLSLGAKFVEVSKYLDELNYVSFEDIQEELNNLSMICKTYDHIKSVEKDNTVDFNLDNISCDNDFNPFSEVDEVIDWQLKLITSVYLTSGQTGVEKILGEEIEILKSKFASFKIQSNIPKCQNYWRDKTKNDILSIARTGCIERVEVPMISIASDFKNGRVIYFKPNSNEDEIIFKTSPLKCEDK